MGKSHDALIAIVVVLAALALRLFPYLSSGVPYMTDTWPQVANAQALLANTPVSLSPGHGFDSYNIYWPGLTLFMAVFSVMTNVAPLALLPVATPLVNALAFVLLYALLRRFRLAPRHAFIVSLLAGLGLGSAILGAGATKEAFALPLLFSFVLVFLLALESGRLPFLALSLMAFVSLLVAHHLTSLVGLLLAAYLLAHTAFSGKAWVQSGFLSSLTVFSVMTFLTLCYFFVYASSVVLFSVTDSAAVSFFAYELAFLFPLAVGISVMRNRRLVGAWSGFALLSVMAVALGATKVSVTADAPLLTASLALAVAPYIVTVFLGAYSAVRLRLDDWRSSTGFFAFWVLGILGVAYFAAFGTAGVILTSLRIADYAYPALLVLGVAALLSWTRGRGGRAAAVVVTAVLVVGSVAGLVQTAYYAGPLGGNQHVYLPGDVSSLRWVTTNLSHGTRLYGDLRFEYMVPASQGIAMNVTGGYEFLTDSVKAPGGCLLLSSLVSTVGYVFYDYGAAVSHSELSSLDNRTNISSVFDSGQDALYCASA